ncbi:S9 family peptidase [Pseudoxanthomonas gei]|uniref:S9 family peptidase n=1 Tax=Pseudoxanthomonas gei TaxID=1383030 RepID=A0ABX0A744_9GAMM|nr:S9 family peptidase [Pseudoxanthomonas gei]NDK37354.1 S9 family peptidase [Pseudoxanthomonas gei]
MRITSIGFALLLAFLSGTAMAREIPIDDFFRDSEFTSVRLSPDGKHLAVIVPQADRTVLAVLDTSNRKVVGKWDYGQDRHFSEVVWANNKRLLFWVGIKTGSLDFKVAKGDLYSSNLDGSGRIDIPNGAFYSIVDLTPEDPDTILVERSLGSAFLFKLNVNNGRTTTVASAPVDGGGFLVDHDGNARYAYGEMEDGREVTYRRDGEKWKLVHEVPRSGAVYRPLGFAADNQHVYVSKGDEGKPEALMLIDPETNTERQLSSDGIVDPSGYLWSSDDKTLLAVRYDEGIPYWDFVAPEHPEAKVYAGVIKAFPGKAVLFGGITDDGGRFAFRVYSDTDPGEVYLFDIAGGKATYMLSSREWIKPAEMSKMKPVEVTARDGKKIYGYLTIPTASNGRNLPLIINPHGGPHGVRDDWGFNPEVQLLANRGYAVLQMNYRGSGGYGNAFISAGYRNWGTSMQDDLTDSVKSLVSQGIVDGNRVCIYGASYGGYAALMSVVREPDLYKCTVGYVGVYSLPMMFAKGDIQERKSGRNFQKDVLPQGNAALEANSPAYNVAKIHTPIMLVHGAKDQRVPIQQMHFLIGELKKAGKQPEVMVVEEKEAHGFRDLKNNVNLYTKMLAFFDKYIGPKAAPASATQ